MAADNRQAGQRARTFTALTLADWGLGAFAEPVQLCVSELLGNCVKHARPDACPARPHESQQVRVALRLWPTWLVLEVSDGDPRPPVLPCTREPIPDLEEPEALWATSGRGLRIVRDLADGLWWRPREGGGKSVLARFATVGNSPRWAGRGCGSYR